MKNKKILFLCKETSTYPLLLLTSMLQKDENVISAYFFMAPECMYDECELNKSTYYEFAKNKTVKIYDIKKYARLFSDNLENPQYDKNYIEWVEKNFTHFKPLGLQLMSSQFTTSPYHFRNYFSNFTYEQQILFLEYYYKNTIEIINDFKPDVILDFDDSELGRTVINEVAYKYNIPYITFEHPRFEKYKLFTFQQGIGIDDFFIDAYKKFSSKDDSQLADELSYISNYSDKKEIMPDEYKDTATATYSAPKVIDSIKEILYMIQYFYYQDRSIRTKKIKKSNKLLYPDSIEYIKFYCRVGMMKHKLYKNNEYFEKPIEGEKYVYMPLHLIPESTTFVKAPLYVDELNIIESISKTLPIGWRLYVKEHQAMIGERGVEFYNKIKELSNVRLVQINYYKDPKPWIINSQGVITITGTSSYEAALLGKPSIIFGDVPHSLISSINRVKSFEDLKDNIEKFKNYKINEDDIHSCAAYIAAVKHVGIDIEYKYLMTEGEKIVKNKVGMSTKYEMELLKLQSFYYKAYDYYDKKSNH